MNYTRYILIFFALLAYINHCNDSFVKNYHYKSYQKISTEFKISTKNQKSYYIEDNTQNRLLLIKANSTFSKGNRIYVDGLILPNICFEPTPYCPPILLAYHTNLISRNKTKDNILRNIAIKHIKTYSSNPLSLALLAGYKNEIPQDLKDSFFATGTSHLLAISGLHIGGIALISFLFFRKILAFSQFISLKYDNKKIATILSLICSLIFLIISNYPVSAKRAFIFISIYSIGTIFSFSISYINLILVTALTLLIIEPTILFSAGFQLSFAAALPLVIYFNKFSHHSYLKKLALSSMLTTITTLPFVIYHFGLASLISPLVNIIAIPITSIVIMPLGLLSLFLSLIALGTPAFYLFDQILIIFTKLIEFLADFAFYTPNLQLNPLSLFLSLCSLLTLLIAAKRKMIYLSITFYISAFLAPHLYFYKPDVVITSNNKLFIVKEDKEFIYPNRKFHKIITDKLQKNFARLKSIDSKNYQGNNLNCLDKYCSYQLNDKKLAIINFQIDSKTYQNLCNTHNLIISFSTTANCQKTLSLNKYDIAKYNVIKIYLNKSGIKLQL